MKYVQNNFLSINRKNIVTVSSIEIHNIFVMSRDWGLFIQS